MKKISVIIYPFLIIIFGALVGYIGSFLFNEWVFIPLAILYWAATFLLSLKELGKNGIKALFQKPVGKIGWLLLSLFVGLIPLPIMLMNLELLQNPPVISLWLLFALINPWFEEIFWRGMLLQRLPFGNAGNSAYSTLLFVLSHPLMWGIFSIANRSWMTWVSLIIMGVVWAIVFIKTKSLRWCLISHWMVDIFNLSVFVFLNLYIPPVM